MAPASASSSSRKRSSPVSEGDEKISMAQENARTIGIPTPPTTDHRSLKRRRLSLWGLSATYAPRADRSTETDLAKPLPSPVEALPLTVRLRLTIPQPETLDPRKLARRITAARLWVPKLGRPFPSHKEVKDAYPLKLMRHYPARHSTPAPNFIKPHIDKSVRVERLLQQFPLTIPMAAASSTVSQGSVSPPSTNHTLRANRRITNSEQAQKLAWKNFAATERDRIDRGREALMESGLEVEDLTKEERGEANGLPEWKKRYTGKFARD